MIVAHPVLEILRADEFTLWPVAGSGPFDLLPLRGGLEPAEIGTAVMCIPDYTDFADDSYYPWPRPTEPLGAFLHGLVAMDEPEAPGGVRFTDTTTGVTVLPGCCVKTTTGRRRRQPCLRVYLTRILTGGGRLSTDSDVHDRT